MLGKCLAATAAALLFFLPGKAQSQSMSLSGNAITLGVHAAALAPGHHRFRPFFVTSPFYNGFRPNYGFYYGFRPYYFCPRYYYPFYAYYPPLYYSYYYPPLFPYYFYFPLNGSSSNVAATAELTSRPRFLIDLSESEPPRAKPDKVNIYPSLAAPRSPLPQPQREPPVGDPPTSAAFEGRFVSTPDKNPTYFAYPSYLAPRTTSFATDRPARETEQFADKSR